MKKESWVVHSMATCEDCDWVGTNHKNAQAVGANHAKHHNHFVRVETVLVSRYNEPRDIISVCTKLSLCAEDEE